MLLLEAQVAAYLMYFAMALVHFRPNSSVPVRRTWSGSSYHSNSFELGSSSEQRWSSRLSRPRWERHPATLAHACLCTTQMAPGMQLPFYHCPVTPSSIPHHTSQLQPQSATVRGLLRSILQQEGMAGLWRGLDSALLMTLPTVLLYYPMYDFLYLNLTLGSGPGPFSGTSRITSTSGHQVDLGAAAPLVAGAAARTVAAVAVAPLELMRTRQQAMGRQATTWQVLRSTLGLEPSAAASPATYSQVLRRIPQLWTGLSATLARDVPFSAAYWGLVEPLRASLITRRATDTGLGQVEHQGQAIISHRDLVFANLVAGSVAGTVAAIVTTPFDVVKTVMQIAPLSHGSSYGGDSNSSSKGRARFTSVLRSVYQERGLAGLFVGVGPRAARCAPACAIAVASYEWVKATLAK
jgi:solute carrier family 25 protein 39/40